MTLLARELRAAVAAGELSVAYQPQYALGPGLAPRAVEPLAPLAPVAVEALCRWTHPTLGEISPEHFIPLAEREGFLDELDARVLGVAVAQVARWRREGHDLGLATNASPSHFSTRFADAVVARLDEFDLDPSAVTIEITEAPAPQLRPEMEAAITTLRATGVAIAVDDFAMGGVTIEMLESMPIDEVKIDRSLTQRTDAAADAVIAGVVAEAARRGWRIVAEGIETIEDLARSLRRGCQRGQGYLWAAPMPAERIESLLPAV